MNPEEDAFTSREMATQLRNQFNVLNWYFPVQEVARVLNLSCVSSDENISRWHIALQIADHFKAPDRDVFARSLLAPLYLLEPLIVRGKDTGKTYFFGLLKKRESYSTWELANIFGVPEFVIDQQAQKLLY